MRRHRRYRVDDIWGRFSASKIGSLTACPLRGVFEFVLEEPGPLHPYTALGQVLHYVFYLFFRPHPQTKRYPYLTREALLGFWKGIWWGAVNQQYGFGGRRTPANQVAWEYEGQAGSLFGAGYKALDMFFDHFDPVRHDGRLHLVERRFKLRWHHVTLSGIVDRIDVEDDGAVLNDYKSKRYPDHLLETGVQMTLYQLAYEHCFRKTLPGQPPLKAIRIYDYRNGTFQEAPLRPAHEFGMLLQYLTESSAYLRGVFTGQSPSFEQLLTFKIYDPADIFHGDVSPKLPRGEHCTYCSYYRQCRQWELGQLPIARLLLRQKIDRHDLAHDPHQQRIPFDEQPVVQIGAASMETAWRQSRIEHVQQSLPFNLS